MRSGATANIDDRVRQIVREELARAGRSMGATYTKGDLPPELGTYKAFAKLCASGAIAGAAQTAARGPWVVSREDWHRARSRRPAPRLTVVSSAMTDEQLAALALRGTRAS